MLLYKDIIAEVYNGKVVKSNKCLYVKPNEESPTYWKWIGEDTWTTGDINFQECVNESEKDRMWEIVY